MAAIRSAADIAKKWADVTPGRAAQYEAGVRSPVRDYAANTIAANDAWKAGTQAAIAADRFKRGVTRAGNARWQERAIQLGPARFGPGVLVARDDFEQGFAPYREAIAGATLPPRGPRRSPQNLQRVNAMVAAISARKEALLKGA
jgi:hypothetical protein